MGTSMGLPAYLTLVAERIEAAEAAGRPTEVLRLIEVMRDELSDQARKRVVALGLSEVSKIVDVLPGG